MRPSIPTSVLLDAAAAIVADRGFEGVRMDAVAARAGVAKGVPYGRFPSKTELLRAMIDHELALAMRRAVELVEADPDGGRLSRIWAHSVAALHSRPALVRLYSGKDSPLPAATADRAERTPARAAIGADFIRELQATGLVESGIDAESLAMNLTLWNRALAMDSSRLTPDLDSLIGGMGDVLARAADTGRGDVAAGKAVFARFVGELVAERREG